MLCKCIDCRKGVPHGCNRCMECNEKALKATFAKSPELKKAFEEALNAMRKPENIEAMAREITPVVQAVSALKHAMDGGGDTDAV